MELVKVAVTAVVSLAVLFLLTKLMGNKQISQLNIFDYIVGISIGSIAAEMATELEEPAQPLVAMVIYAVIATAISVWTDKSVKARRVLTGKPLILLDNGNLYRENLKKARMDLSEFLMFCRMQGYFDLGQIQTALLEHNGSVSILPVSLQRPATPADLSIQPDQELLPIPVVMDGCIMQENLKKAGKDSTWLMHQLQKKGYQAPEEILLAMCSNNQLTVFPVSTKKEARDPSDG
ncbi:MAG: DUF421 domain-containing protein [Clostridiales bacterium]|nr:DUF421 domain-containing protein [Clostridiales bacterium]